MYFLKKYGLTNEEINTLLEENDQNYIKNFTEEMLNKKEKILLKYNIDFINELILFDIGIFSYTEKEFEKRINEMIKTLGNNYLNIINNDISIFIDFIYNNKE